MSDDVGVVETQETAHTRRGKVRYCLFILIPTYVGLALAAVPVQTKIPFAAYMPLSLAVVDDGEVSAAIHWKVGIAAVYLAIGVIALSRRSIRLSLIVPAMLVASFPLFFLRFFYAMGSDFR